MFDLHRILGRTAHTQRLATGSALLCAGLLLSGCGQKGPLFLPATAKQIEQPTKANTCSKPVNPPVKASPQR
jgi:predicted small lipoprotein YifL